jgi:aryl-alcohol dehydrogenase-like predicted oxidoreductase
MSTWEFQRLQHVAEKNGWHKFISMQNFYNLIYREEEREMIPFCKETGVGLIPWSPIARGMLARPYGSEKTARLESDRILSTIFAPSLKEADKEVTDRVEEVAKKKGVAMAQVATAWVLKKGTCPIVGMSSIERIDAAVAALGVDLTEEDCKYLEAPYLPKPVWGH